MDKLELDIKQALTAFWDERALPPSGDGQSTVADLVAPVESMTAVDALLTLEEIVKFELPVGVIQAGGYQTKEEFVAKLSAAVMERVKDRS